MSEQQQNTEQKPEGAASGTTEVKLVRHGKEHVVPMEKAVALAQKGFDYEQRLSSLKAQEEELRGKAAKYSEFERFTAHLDANPQVARAVAAALERPEAVMKIIEGGASESDDGEGESDKPTQAPNKELSELKAKLESVEGEISKRSAIEGRKALEETLKKEIAGYPWLEGKNGNLAFKTALAHMVLNPGEPLSAVVAAVATDIKESVEEVRAKELEANNQRLNLQTLSPRRSSPIASPKEKLTKKDWSSGKLSEQFKDAAKKFGFLG